MTNGSSGGTSPSSAFVKVFGCRPVRDGSDAAEGPAFENLEGREPRDGEAPGDAAASYGDLARGAGVSRRSGDWLAGAVDVLTGLGCNQARFILLREDHDDEQRVAAWRATSPPRRGSQGSRWATPRGVPGGLRAGPGACHPLPPGDHSHTDRVRESPAATRSSRCSTPAARQRSAVWGQRRGVHGQAKGGGTLWVLRPPSRGSRQPRVRVRSACLFFKFTLHPRPGFHFI